jgi:AcrR family transcriptional regulator
LYRAELRRVILDAARTAFLRDGYESLSMRALAEAAGLSHGAIYLHFKEKEEIFEALVGESFDQLAAALQTLRGRGGDPVRFLKRAGRKYVEFGLSNPGAYEFAFLLRRPGRAGRPHLAYDYLRAAVQRCIDAGRFRVRNADAAGQAIWTAVHGVTALLIARPDFPWTSRKTLIGRVVDSAVDGLLVPSAQPSAVRPSRRPSARTRKSATRRR